MIIARQKKQENIAEFVLYMWQIEDLLRATNFQIALIEKNIVERYKTDPQTRKEIKEWYEGLMEQMRDENIKEKGHLQSVKNIVNELYELHLHLLSNPKEAKYRQTFQEAQSYIAGFRQKSDSTANDVQVCFNALYAKLLMRLRKQKITQTSDEGFKLMAQLLALLSQKYKKLENGEYEL